MVHENEHNVIELFGYASSAELDQHVPCHSLQDPHSLLCSLNKL